MSDTPREVFTPRPGSVPWVKPAAPGKPLRRFMLEPDGATALELTPTGWEPAMRLSVEADGWKVSAEEAAHWSARG